MIKIVMSGWMGYAARRRPSVIGRRRTRGDRLHSTRKVFSSAARPDSGTQPCCRRAR